MSAIFSLVYVSASSELFDELQLEAILSKARRNNIRADVTGMLLYYEGGFMQVLEGEEASVRDTYARIIQDPRHHHITKLLEEHIPERNFPDWSMGYNRINWAKHLEGFSDFAGIDQFLDYFQETPQKSMMLLQSFRTTSQR